MVNEKEKKEAVTKKEAVVKRETKKEAKPVKPVKGAPPKAPPSKPAKGIIDPATLTSIERAVYDQGGEKAVLLFRIADGKITIGEAMDELGITEAEIDELIKKMENKFISIEEVKEKKEKKIERKEPAQIAVDVPKKTVRDPITQFTTSSEIGVRYGPSGRKVYDLIDGKKDIIDLAFEIHAPLNYIDSIMWYLAEKKIASFKKILPAELKQRYGAAGVEIYEEHGRRGLLLYRFLEIFDPVTAIKAMDIDPLEGISIYETIFRVISLPYPLDSKNILKKLLRK